jgi:GrpB-like predicted nucleotidyltransferase (UPF0157 family)
MRMDDEIFRIRESQDELLESERARVLDLLRSALPAAQNAEVGSTAVPGAIGKQDVDIAVLVDANQFTETCTILDRLLIHNEQQLTSDCYRGYHASDICDVSVQVTVRGGPYDTFHDFVKALRNDFELLQAYNQLKRAWDGKPMDEYRLAKADFIAKALDRG